MDSFVFSLPKEGAYYFDKLDTNRVNIVYTYQKRNIFWRVLRKLNNKLLKARVTILNRLVCNIFYDKKIINAVKNCSGAAILDTGVGEDLLLCVKKNKCPNFYLIIWNSVKEKDAFMYLKYLNKNQIYSYSESDSGKYGFHFINDFYLIDYPIEDVPIERDMFYLGADKNRHGLLDDFLQMIKNDFTYKFLIYTENKKTDNKDGGIIYFNKPISYQEYVRMILESRCLVDFNHHSNISFRTLEAMVFHKKYITNNEFIRNRDFYNPSNILIVNKDTTVKDIAEFMKCEYIPVPREIMERYDFYHIYNFFKEKALAK